MFRFTIRDVLWLTVVVALCLGWSNDRYAMYRRMTAINDADMKRQREFHRMQSQFHMLKSALDKRLVEQQEEAVNRELDLKTTINALKLRLGEDPFVSRPTDKK
jgi:hypothetical protein